MKVDKVLIIDDVALNREMLKFILEDYYEVDEASSGPAALQKLQDGNDYAAILLDYVMPGMNGDVVLEKFKEKNISVKTPVLMISAEIDSEVELNCLNLGACDFIHKPFIQEVVLRRIRNNIDLFQYKEKLEDRVRVATSQLTKQNYLLIEQANKLKEINEKIIDTLATIVEYRDLESGQHILRVKSFTKVIAKQLASRFPKYGLTSEMIDVIVSASAMHDIGKIAISDTILLKPGKLTNEEFEIMKTHTTKGYDLLCNVHGLWGELFDQVVKDICLYHHEKFDGKGYPKGLKGNDIPISAQLVSMADVYDALTSVRCYKKSFTHQQAVEMILNNECGVFNPDIITSFKCALDDMEVIAQQLKDDIA